MVKSYQTSGGTVLSTNWNEVKNHDYEKELKEGTLLKDVDGPGKRRQHAPPDS